MRARSASVLALICFCALAPASLARAPAIRTSDSSLPAGWSLSYYPQAGCLISRRVGDAWLQLDSQITAPGMHLHIGHQAWHFPDGDDAPRQMRITLPSSTPGIFTAIPQPGYHPAPPMQRSKVQIDIPDRNSFIRDLIAAHEIEISITGASPASVRIPLADTAAAIDAWTRCQQTHSR